MADYVKIEVLNQSDLDKILGTDPKMEQMFRSCIKKVLSNARAGAVKDLKGKVGTGYRHSAGDPRDAYKAVKYMVYKRELGGNISILNKRKASNTRLDGTGLSQYYGSDRGPILRFLNSGTGERKSRFGNRGSIRTSRMFADVGERYIQQALAELNTLIQDKIELRTQEI